MFTDPTFHYNLTVFTPFQDDENQKLKWYKYQIPNCFWGQTNEKRFSSFDLYNENKTMARIPSTENFIKYKSWCSLPNEVKADYFSLTSRSIIINGFIDDEIPDNKSETAIMEKYGEDCFKVNTLKINTSIPLLAHYYVSGV